MTVEGVNVLSTADFEKLKYTLSIEHIFKDMRQLRKLNSQGNFQQIMRLEVVSQPNYIVLDGNEKSFNI